MHDYDAAMFQRTIKNLKLLTGAFGKTDIKWILFFILPLVYFLFLSLSHFPSFPCNMLYVEKKMIDHSWYRYFSRIMLSYSLNSSVIPFFVPLIPLESSLRHVRYEKLIDKYQHHKKYIDTSAAFFLNSLNWSIYLHSFIYRINKNIDKSEYTYSISIIIEIYF